MPSAQGSVNIRCTTSFTWQTDTWTHSYTDNVALNADRCSAGDLEPICWRNFRVTAGQYLAKLQARTPNSLELKPSSGLPLRKTICFSLVNRVRPTRLRLKRYTPALNKTLSSLSMRCHGACRVNVYGCIGGHCTTRDARVLRQLEVRPTLAWTPPGPKLTESSRRLFSVYKQLRSNSRWRGLRNVKSKNVMQLS